MAQRPLHDPLIDHRGDVLTGNIKFPGDTIDGFMG